MLSSYLQREILNAYFVQSGGYLALFSNGVELAVSGYQRKAISWQLFSTDPVLVKNSLPLAFGPAGSNWPDITQVAIFDAATGGNQLTQLELLENAESIHLGNYFSLDMYSLEISL